MTKELLSALRSLRTPILTDEYQLHGLIEQALSLRGIAYEKEWRLGPYARVDFLCQDVAIEAKKGRPQRRALIKQLSRYLQYDQIKEIIVVTEQTVDLPETLLGKPVHVVALNRLWGVAL